MPAGKPDVEKDIGLAVPPVRVAVIALVIAAPAVTERLPMLVTVKSNCEGAGVGVGSIPVDRV